jgi:hypothetical protein
MNRLETLADRCVASGYGLGYDHPEENGHGDGDQDFFHRAAS